MSQNKETEKPQRHIGVVVKEDRPYSFRLGERFVIGALPSLSLEVKPAFYRIYDRNTLAFRGIMPAEMFKILIEFVEPAVEEIEVLEEIEQLSLFDEE